MNYPILFYGINLGRISSENIQSTKNGIMDNFNNVNVEMLEDLAKQYECMIYISGDYLDMAPISSVHIGVPIHNNYRYGEKVKGREREDDAELVAFDIDQIRRVDSKPDRLITMLAQIGIKTLPEDLMLYGTCHTD